MKSTFIGEIFLQDFKGRQVLYILTETNWIISKTQSTIYRLQVSFCTCVPHRMFFRSDSRVNPTTKAAGPTCATRHSLAPSMVVRDH